MVVDPKRLNFALFLVGLKHSQRDFGRAWVVVQFVSLLPPVDCRCYITHYLGCCYYIGKCLSQCQVLLKARFQSRIGAVGQRRCKRGQFLSMNPEPLLAKLADVALVIQLLAEFNDLLLRRNSLSRIDFKANSWHLFGLANPFIRILMLAGLQRSRNPFGCRRSNLFAIANTSLEEKVCSSLKLRVLHKITKRLVLNS